MHTFVAGVHECLVNEVSSLGVKIQFLRIADVARDVSSSWDRSRSTPTTVEAELLQFLVQGVAMTEAYFEGSSEVGPLMCV